MSRRHVVTPSRSSHHFQKLRIFTTQELIEKPYSSSSGYLLKTVTVVAKRPGLFVRMWRGVKRFFKGWKKKKPDDIPEGLSSLYEDVTKSSRGKPSVHNRKTDVTVDEFVENLEKNGFEMKGTSEDGKSTLYAKEGEGSYRLRKDKDGEPTADFRKREDGRGDEEIKIRLKEDKEK